MQFGVGTGRDHGLRPHLSPSGRSARSRANRRVLSTRVPNRCTQLKPVAVDPRMTTAYPGSALLEKVAAEMPGSLARPGGRPALDEVAAALALRLWPIFMSRL